MKSIQAQKKNTAERPKANLRATRVKKNAPQFGKIQTQILLKDQVNLRATRVKKCSSIWTNTNKNFAERPGNLRATKNGPQFGQALSDAE